MTKRITDAKNKQKTSKQHIIDARCCCQNCKNRTEDVYWMEGRCYNCGVKGILILYRAKDKTSEKDCPVCQCWHTVHATQLAAPSKIPPFIRQEENYESDI